MNSSKVLLGLLGGIAIGAIAGILFAPAKGAKTRKRILTTGKGYVTDAKGKFNDLTKDLAGKYDTFIGDGNELVDHKEAK